MKNKILLIALLIAGAIAGSIAGTSATHVESLSWLAYSKEINVSPFTINLVVLKFTFGFDFAMSVAQILFMILAVAIYPKIKKIIE